MKFVFEKAAGLQKALIKLDAPDAAIKSAIESSKIQLTDAKSKAEQQQTRLAHIFVTAPLKIDLIVRKAQDELRIAREALARSVAVLRRELNNRVRAQTREPPCRLHPHLN